MYIQCHDNAGSSIRIVDHCFVYRGVTCRSWGHSGGSRESCDSYFRWTYDMCWLMDGYWMHACFAYRDGERGDNCTALSMLHAHYVY